MNPAKLFRAALAQCAANGGGGETESGEDKDQRDHDSSAAPGKESKREISDHRQGVKKRF